MCGSSAAQTRNCSLIQAAKGKRSHKRRHHRCWHAKLRLETSGFASRLTFTINLESRSVVSHPIRTRTVPKHGVHPSEYKLHPQCSLAEKGL